MNKLITIPLSFFIKANKNHSKYTYTPKDQWYIDSGKITKIHHYAQKIEIAINYGYDSYIDFVRGLYWLGLSSNKVAQIANINGSNVRKILHRFGDEIRKK